MFDFEQNQFLKRKLTHPTDLICFLFVMTHPYSMEKSWRFFFLIFKLKNVKFFLHFFHSCQREFKTENRHEIYLQRDIRRGDSLVQQGRVTSHHRHVSATPCPQSSTLQCSALSNLLLLQFGVVWKKPVESIDKLMVGSHVGVMLDGVHRGTLQDWVPEILATASDITRVVIGIGSSVNERRFAREWILLLLRG